VAALGADSAAERLQSAVMEGACARASGQGTGVGRTRWAAQSAILTGRGSARSARTADATRGSLLGDAVPEHEEQVLVPEPG
jgi:hypothetical protein